MILPFALAPVPSPDPTGICDADALAVALAASAWQVEEARGGVFVHLRWTRGETHIATDHGAALRFDPATGRAASEAGGVSVRCHGEGSAARGTMVDYVARLPVATRRWMRGTVVLLGSSGDPEHGRATYAARVWDVGSADLTRAGSTRLCVLVEGDELVGAAIVGLSVMAEGSAVVDLQLVAFARDPHAQ